MTSSTYDSGHVQASVLQIVFCYYMTHAFIVSTTVFQNDLVLSV